MFETKRDRKISSHAAIRRSRQLKKIGFYTFLLLLVIAAGIFLYKNNPNPESAAHKRIEQASPPRVAVLPLENLSNDLAQEYFCFGLAEEILNQMQKMGGLIVRSRTSSFQYKNTDKPLPVIAKELDVEFLLEGSVFKIEDSIRIVLQLVNGLTDDHIWVETYKEDYGNILSILSNIPIEVANALKAEVTPEIELEISRIPTNNITAYDYYLKGVSSSNNFWYSGSEYDYLNAVDYFKSAIKLDDSFAAAYAHLAQVYRFYLSYTKYREINLDWTDSVLVLCDKAIQLDPNLALAYANLWDIYNKLDKTKKAEEAFLKLADLQPNDRESVWPLAFYYNVLGQYIESLKLFNRLKDLGHIYGLPAVYCIFGQTYLSAGDLINAREAYSESLRIRPDFGAGFRDVAQFEFAKGDFKEALKNCIKADSLDPGYLLNKLMLIRAYVYLNDFDKANQYLSIYLDSLKRGVNHGFPYEARGHYHAYILWYTGNKEEAKVIFQQTIKYFEEKTKNMNGYDMWNPGFNLAKIHAFLGNKEEAYRWLYKCEEKGFSHGHHLEMKHNPFFNNLWEDQEFKELYNRVEAEKKIQVEEIRKLQQEGII